jgi:hypothetical protein
MENPLELLSADSELYAPGPGIISILEVQRLLLLKTHLGTPVLGLS